MSDMSISAVLTLDTEQFDRTLKDSLKALRQSQQMMLRESDDMAGRISSEIASCRVELRTLEKELERTMQLATQTAGVIRSLEGASTSLLQRRYTP